MASAAGGLPHRPWYYTDEWRSYQGVLPKRAHEEHPKSGGQTSIVEAINCSLRQCCAVLVRKSCCFSRSLAMHRVRIQLAIDEHDRNGTPYSTTAGKFTRQQSRQ